MGMTDFRTQATRQTGSHASSSYIDHNRNFECINRFPERIETLIINGEVAHNGMEVKAKDVQFVDSRLRLLNGSLPFETINGSPGLGNDIGMTVPHPGYIFIGAGRSSNNGFNIKGHQNCLYASSTKLVNDLIFLLWNPGTVPVLA